MLCEREPAGADAERFLCVHELVSKSERPPPGFTTPVSLRHIRSTRAGPRRRIIMGNTSHVPPSHRTATSDRTLGASGRRKGEGARGVHDGSPSCVQTSRGHPRGRAGARAQSAVEGMRGRDAVQRGRTSPARGPRRPTSPQTLMSGFAPRGSHVARRGSSVLQLCVPGPRG